MEPSREWDIRCEREDAEYAALIEGKSCLDCLKCKKFGQTDDHGFCVVWGDYVTVGDNPRDNDCGEYE